MAFSVSRPVLPIVERKRGCCRPRGAGRGQIFIEKLLELVMCRHLVLFAAFFAEPHPPALAGGVIVLDLHADDGADAGEGIRHDLTAFVRVVESGGFTAAGVRLRFFWVASAACCSSSNHFWTFGSASNAMNRRFPAAAPPLRT
jgi:hypothetical protein